MSSKYSKIIQVSSVLAGFIAGFVVRTLLEFSATLFGFMAKLYAEDWVRHGVPVAIGLFVFFLLQLHPKIKTYLLEVVTEIDKVVWPSKKDTFSMTCVVCVVLVVSGAVLGLFDLSASAIMRLIMN